MKYQSMLVFTSFLALSVVQTYAQTIAFENPFRQGQFIIDADFHFTTSDYSTDADSPLTIDWETEDIGMEIDFGYSIIDNLVLGLYIELDHIHETTSGPNYRVEEEYDITTYGISGKYYFGSTQFRPFLGVNAGLGTGRLKDTSTDATNKGNLRQLGARGGVAYFFNQSLGFEVLYHFYSLKNSEELSVSGTTFEYDSSSRNGAIEFGIVLSL